MTTKANWPSRQKLRHEICNCCTKPFSYKAHDFCRREYPFTCTPCIRANRYGYDCYYVVDGKRKPTPEYKLWSTIRERCRNPKSKSYKNYGGKGIKVCERWDNFVVFRTDIEVRGYKRGDSILRIKKDQDYTPDNIKIGKNKTSSKLWPYKGNHFTLKQLLKQAPNKLSKSSFYTRLNEGMSMEEILTKPLSVKLDLDSLMSRATNGISRSGLRKRLARGIDPEVAITDRLTPHGSKK